ncbi:MULTISPECIES: peptidase T [Geobacillus]|jgi:tripeptide aminopeptidase|uniref:Peptidase T n=3 Tax=Geobacillus thermodenitrificans TaxID=33940 RepID=PEPT_GEOTN|nr:MULTISPECIES: peptidase T [Geobacillus]A4INW9.1 RecName: Full=Peptidase T; AltName: Full=Aminotripeptidase; Short=Tripeptidase; AltName: Full=Tripeptide aminopeptidase [Geobacillus thermodenitrificans NG80-2]ABO67023.1 Peptidase T (tripeptidase) [Geobacillus thermodenitrificans NG80-2]ARP42773.1 Peptidase T [Geobacillus thermodenitrificans]ATO35941.1 peptidase T [Geobacillus thermodenitrificans]KQB93299.1 Peptidase T [Geobacillus sp. PA-3]MEC5186712.1 tripeptide aminopeptidase [Geobacillus
MKQELIERFTRYVKVDTQSDPESNTCPSTQGQWDLARMLVEELKAIGMEEVTVDENGYVMATLPANTDKNVPTIGFLAHLDTAPEFTGTNVNPQIIEQYDGGDIVLNEQQHIILSPKDFPELANYKGHTLITTDGTTLLGADDKAGIAEIMTAMNYLIQHPEIKHGKVRVAFTPDEEIGRGPHKFDVAQFGAQFAYTVDGGPLGELEYESFNAAEAKITIKGKNVHPGTAKGKMINSIKIALEFQQQLPANEAPEHTDGYEGFYHLLSFQGNVEETKLYYIIRDFDREQFEARKAKMKDIAAALAQKYGNDRISIEINDQYYNMREKIEPVHHIVDIAHEAMTNLGIEPKVKPIRGGTDGSQLSYMGLPTPNIFAGGENFHGRYEYISVDTMVKAAEVIVEIIKLFEQKTS